MQVGCFIGILSITISGLLMMSAGGNPTICVPLAFVIGIAVFAFITWIASSSGDSQSASSSSTRNNATRESQTATREPNVCPTDPVDNSLTSVRVPSSTTATAELEKPQKVQYTPKNDNEFEIRGIDKCNVPHSMFDGELICNLERDYNNQYDTNAVAVIDETGSRIAFVAKEKAAELAPRMDSGECFAVRIIPKTYRDEKWGCCFVALVNRESKVITEQHDPRISRTDDGWYLLLDNADGEFRYVNGALYVTFKCNKLLSNDLDIEWKGRKLTVGTRVSKEMADRLSGRVGGKVSGTPEGISFVKVTQFECPIKIGVDSDGSEVTLNARIDGLLSIVYDEEEIFAVKINHMLKDGMIYHMTDVANLPNIFTHGLLSKNLVVEHGLQQVDIADIEIQGHRDVKLISDGMTLHDYVPFYFNPHNAMLYRVSKMEDHNVVILGVSAETFEGEDYLLSDRNAAARNAHFGNSQSFVDGLDWQTIYSESWNDGDEERNKETKQIMQSELLVPRAVDAEYVCVVICKNRSVAMQVESMISSSMPHIKIRIMPEMFFEREYSYSRYSYGRRGYGRRGSYR